MTSWQDREGVPWTRERRAEGSLPRSGATGPGARGHGQRVVRKAGNGTSWAGAAGPAPLSSDGGLDGGGRAGAILLQRTQTKHRSVCITADPYARTAQRLSALGAPLGPPLGCSASVARGGLRGWRKSPSRSAPPIPHSIWLPDVTRCVKVPGGHWTRAPPKGSGSRVPPACRPVG